jgi:hypothetical protein
LVKVESIHKLSVNDFNNLTMRNTPLKWQALLLFLEEYFVTVTYGMDRASGRLESMETETDETDWTGHEPWLPLWESISGQDSRT